MNVFVSGSECCILYLLLGDKVCVNVRVTRSEHVQQCGQTHLSLGENVFMSAFACCQIHLQSQDQQLQVLTLQHSPSVLEVHTIQQHNKQMMHCSYLKKQWEYMHVMTESVSEYVHHVFLLLDERHHIEGMDGGAWPGSNHSNGKDPPSRRPSARYAYLCMCMFACVMQWC